MTKEIPLTQGKVAIVDDCDYAELSKWKWYHACGYASRHILSNGEAKTVYMHRVIAGTPDGMDTDHINRDTLDNRRCNLRVCTTRQNMMNRRKRANTSSRYIGVSFFKQYGRWESRIRVDGKYKFLGYFDTEEEAALAFNRAAMERGEITNLNQL